MAWSDNRKKDPSSGQLQPLPFTVKLKAASYDNSVGDIAFATLWTDPDFDSSRSAFYYVRVLQIKTSLWTTYDAVCYGAELPTELPAEIQERAYTSTIWHTPGE